MTRLIAALDVSTLGEAEEAARRLRGKTHLFKIGLQLYTAQGPASVAAVAPHGGVFLDLKLHDIPNTVAAAVREAGRLGVHALSLHLSGGADMLKAAAEVRPRPRLWGITVLTSLADFKHLGSPKSAQDLVASLAELARSCGLEGVVCSGLEASAVKALGLEAVVPGVRPGGAPAGDQKRVVTPAEAARLGADYIVVGRPILASPDPAAAAESILEELHAR